MSHRPTIAGIDSLDAHPNAAEVRGILSRLPRIADCDLPPLAAAWHNTATLAEARRRALEPDAPLVLDVLSCFETVQMLFADELRGEADYLNVNADVTSTALKAVRDAIAAAYARPIITPSEHGALLKAWRDVYPTDHVAEPDLGARAADVNSLLAAIPRLASRCHDISAAAEYASIVLTAEAVDEEVRRAACDEAWQAAVLTSRRRVWQLVRHRGAEGVNRYCSICCERRRDDETARVLGLCVDAACGLLVAGTLDDDVVGVLVAPVGCLIPSQRPVTEP